VAHCTPSGYATDHMVFTKGVRLRKKDLEPLIYGMRLKFYQRRHKRETNPEHPSQGCTCYHFWKKEANSSDESTEESQEEACRQFYQHFTSSFCINRCSFSEMLQCRSVRLQTAEHFRTKSCLLSVDETHTYKEGRIVGADLAAESEDDPD